MSIELRPEELKRIEQHGRQTYPDECCGILIGKQADGRKVVMDVLPVHNARGQRRNDAAGGSEATELLKEAYRLLQHLPQKGADIRDWLARADAVVNSSRNRFVIEPQDLLRSDREARSRGMDILAVYHSHPDHPAQPSEYDREHACSWYTTMILAVEKGVPRQVTAWSQPSDGAKFVPEEILIAADVGASATPGAGQAASDHKGAS